MVSKNAHIGVLALQGAFAKHLEMLKALQVKASPIRLPKELNQCDALIIPGGESTTMLRQMENVQFREPLIQFASKKPLFGTCAGLILMSNEELGRTITPLGLMDFSVERNAYGRQFDSFCAKLKIQLKPRMAKTFPCSFIRAPIIRRWGSQVNVLATYKDTPVLVQQGHLLCSTFHPELTDDPTIHSYFLHLLN
jgi:pyridoxal 5'-phosphate synthase pdxT subunit